MQLIVNEDAKQAIIIKVVKLKLPIYNLGYQDQIYFLKLVGTE